MFAVLEFGQITERHHMGRISPKFGDSFASLFDLPEREPPLFSKSTKQLTNISQNDLLQTCRTVGGKSASCIGKSLTPAEMAVQVKDVSPRRGHLTVEQEKRGILAFPQIAP
jgi:hypothetical protein